MAGKRLRLLREVLGYSRPEFAEKLGIPETTIKNYERGDRKPSYTMCEAVLNVYGESTLLYIFGKRELTDLEYIKVGGNRDGS